MRANARGVVPREHASEVPVADTAFRLSRLLKTTPHLWMRLQADWDLHQAPQRERRRRRRIAVPVLYLVLRF
jgi:plasmid maintenance system antidote protein VapI